jgi:hypothetical protein
MSIPVYKNESAWRTFVLLHLSGIHNEIRRLEMTIVGARPPVRPGLSPQKNYRARIIPPRGRCDRPAPGVHRGGVLACGAVRSQPSRAVCTGWG